MSRLRGDAVSPLCAVLLAALAVLASACGCDDHSAPPPSAQPQLIGVLSAFPAELQLLVERATIQETVTIDERIYRRGELGGVQVVLALTGIGLINAENTTRTLIENFPITGIVFSGVAGSPTRIGDVTVPVEWRDTEGMTYPCDPDWLRLAERVAAPGAVELERCTLLPSNQSREVCMPHQPEVFIGGFGSSSDPFNGMPYPCTNGGNDVFGCDVETPTAASAGFEPKGKLVAGVDEPMAVDMETAPVAREAAAHDLPFLAFRAVSDGEGDPLNLPGFPAQFFSYYRLAGRNAAIATIAFLEELAAAS